ncbi:MAG: hypothetical protein ABEI07_00080 [Candidatus Nanohaloarchaea archaeon]
MEEKGGDAFDWIIDVWRQPRYALVIGVVTGFVLAGTLVLSTTPPARGIQADAVGRKVADHYRENSSSELDYRVRDVDVTRSGLYAVTLEVDGETRRTNRTVYVTRDGETLFESEPVHLRGDVSGLSN